MNEPMNHIDPLPIREETTEGIPFRVGFITMEDFKLCAEQVFPYLIEENVLLDIQDPHGVSTFLCSASIYEWLKANGALEQYGKVSS